MLLTQLDVQANARELAKNCALEQFDGASVTLLLAPRHKLLNSKMAQEKLQAALSAYFARPVKLKIRLAETGAAPPATPAAQEQRDRQSRQQLAVEAITQDPFVREAQAELGAEIVENSIKPIEQENAA